MTHVKRSPWLTMAFVLQPGPRMEACGFPKPVQQQEISSKNKTQYSSFFKPFQGKLDDEHVDVF